MGERVFVKTAFVDGEFLVALPGIIAWLEHSAGLIRGLPSDMPMTAETVSRWLEGRLDVLRDLETVHRIEQAG